MRVAIGGFSHESNSFSMEKTDLDMFRTLIYSEKDVMIEKHRHDRRLLGGYIEYAEERGWDIVPLVAAEALPGGMIKKETYEYIKRQICENLKGEKLDGILLHLHGAMVAEGVEDCEGDVLTSIRQIVGRDMPILMVNDLHANVSPLMIENVNGLFGYDTFPHEDMYDREREACQLFERIVEEGIETCCVMAQPPLLLPSILTDTNTGAMKPVVEKGLELERDAEIINASAFAGFYGSDMYNIGASAVVVTKKQDKQKGMEAAKKLADFIWEVKDDFFVETMPLEGAIAKAQKEGGLWIFADESDDPCGGGPGDGTYLLERLIKADIRQAAVAAIHDPEIVSSAFGAGLGELVDGMLGSKKDHLHGIPVKIHGKVVALHEGKIPFVYWDEKDLQNPGRVAVIQQNGIQIVVTEHKTITENIDIFKYLDMDVRRYNILILKGLGGAFEKAYENVAKGVIKMDSIGITSPDVKKIGDFRKIRRPIFPLDENVQMRYK